MARTTDRPSPRQPSDIKVLYRFHQNNNVSISEVAHTSPPGSFLHTVQARGADMELQSPRGEFIFGMVLATAMTILAVTAWAFPLYSISGGGSWALRLSHLPPLFSGPTVIRPAPRPSRG